MNDILPNQITYWQYLEQIFRDLVQSYSYQEIRTPIIEDSNLFFRSIGEATDIVEKETYTFDDRNGDSLTLRPEGTAGVVRAGIEHQLFYGQVQRLWYLGPIFRHERPQKGRYRQFYQFGLEAFGMAGPDIDVELLLITWRLWQQLKVADNVVLQLNTLGTFEERKKYCELLVKYFSQHQDQLDADSQRRLSKNPLRILDSKNPDMQDLITNAPSIEHSLSEQSLQHFRTICNTLEQVGIPYQINHRLVRGIDYYCHTVFEWVSDNLGAQGTICAGGRYDGLVAEVGGSEVPAVGMAMGVERILLLLQQQDFNLDNAPDIYLVSDVALRDQALILSEQIHQQLSDAKVLTHCGAGSFKAQIKKADKSGAKLAIILGEQEAQNQQVTVKYLREDKPQQLIQQTDLIQHLKTVIK